MLGGEFLGHGSQQEARVRVVDANFPGLRALSEDFTIKEEWYSLKNFRQDNHVLLVLETAGMHDPHRFRSLGRVRKEEAASTITPWATVKTSG